VIILFDFRGTFPSLEARLPDEAGVRGGFCLGLKMLKITNNPHQINNVNDFDT
jgi:hypothetical protein